MKAKRFFTIIITLALTQFVYAQAGIGVSNAGFKIPEGVYIKASFFEASDSASVYFYQVPDVDGFVSLKTAASLWLYDSLHLTDNLYLASGAKFYQESKLTVDGDLSVASGATFMQDTVLEVPDIRLADSGTMIINNSVRVDSVVSDKGIVILKGDLQVNKDLVMSNDAILDVSGELAVSGNLVASGSTININGPVEISQSVNLQHSDVNLNDTLNVPDISSASSTILVNGFLKVSDMFSSIDDSLLIQNAAEINDFSKSGGYLSVNKLTVPGNMNASYGKLVINGLADLNTVNLTGMDIVISGTFDGTNADISGSSVENNGNMQLQQLTVDSSNFDINSGVTVSNRLDVLNNSLINQQAVLRLTDTNSILYINAADFIIDDSLFAGGNVYLMNGDSTVLNKYMQVDGNFSIVGGRFYVNGFFNQTSVKGQVALTNQGLLELYDKATVYGNISVDPSSEFNIREGSSLLHYNNFIGKANVDKTLIVSEAVNTEMYGGFQTHFVGSPVTQQSADVFSGGFVFSYDEANNTWQPVQEGDYLEPVTGYSVLFPKTKKITFNGTLNSLSKSISLSKQGGGWFLLSNPFVSAIDWTSSGVIAPNLTGVLYFWNVDHYSTYNVTTHIGTVPDASNIIAPMQAFFVEALSSTTVTINNSARLHKQDAVFYKKDNTDLNILKLSVSNNYSSDEVVIYQYPKATNNYDLYLDAKKLFSDMDVVPQISVKSDDGTLLAMQAIDETIDQDKIIPVYFKTGYDDWLTLKVEQYGITATGFLVDRYSGNYYPLIKGFEYTFKLKNTESLEHRFDIVFGIDNPELSDLDMEACSIVYSNDNLVVNLNNELVSKKLILDVYDMSGRKVLTKQVSGMFTVTIPFSPVPGVYNVYLHGEDFNYNTKIVKY